MNLIKGTKLYNTFGEKVVVINVRDDGFFDTKLYSVVSISVDKRKETQVLEEERQYNLSDIGCIIFYNEKDIKKGEILSTFKEYEWNKKNIVDFYEKKRQKELADILSNAPSRVLLNDAYRKKLIAGYHDMSYSQKEELEFFKKYRGMYFARMDFDVEYYKKNRELLWKKHYYNKIYVGKHGTVYDENHCPVIIDWRSPLASLVNDNERKTYKRENDYIYNYDMLLKRRFPYPNSFEFNNVWIANSKFYKEGDVDPFLITVLTQLRHEGNERAVDIIETIQKEQNEIVRMANKSFYVQGCAGSGKTMILLHRLSYLTYNDKNLDFSRVKIITPNENIILQLKDLSAQLEISNIEQMTIEQYYLSILKEYSSTLYDTLTNKYANAFGREGTKFTIKSENSLNEMFLNYVYSDDFKKLLDERYSSYFDNIFSVVSHIVKTENKYDLRTLVNLVRDIFTVLEKREKNKAEIENLKNNLEKLDDTIKNLEKNIAKLQNKDETLLSNSNKKQQEKINAIDKIIKIDEKLDKIKTDKSNVEVQLKKINAIKLEVDINKEYKEEKIESLEKLQPTIKEFEDKIEQLNKDIYTIKRMIDSLKEEILDKEIKYQSLQREYQAVAALGIFKKMKIKAEYQNVKKIKELAEQDFTIKSATFEKLNQDLNSVTTQYNNYLLNAFFYLKEIKDGLSAQFANLDDNEKALLNEKNEIINKFHLDDSNYVLEKEKHLNILKDAQSQKNDAKKELTKLENDLSVANDQKAKCEYNLRLLGILPKEEELAFKRLCNKLITKSNNKFENRIKLTGNNIVEEILMPELNLLYQKYNIVEGNSIFKYKLYLMLYIFVKLRGEKSLSSLICIDEAQDISLNEYRVIRSANSDAVFNLYGDTNQLIYRGRGLEQWDYLKNAGFAFQGFKLNRNYRNVSNITQYCNKNLALNMTEMGIEGEDVEEITLNSLQNYLKVINIVIVKDREILKYFNQICQDYNFIDNKDVPIVKNKINVITIEMSKGMEFSKVIVIDKDMTMREKYIAYTRALNRLVVCKIS